MSEHGTSSDTTDERELATEMLARFQTGESKSSLEIEYWNDGTSHGKRFTAFVRKHLGIETETKSHQAKELEKLRKILKRHGIAPEDIDALSTEDRLVAKARETALAAVRLYNDPTAGFRTDGFIVWMIIAWNCLLQAILERDGVGYIERDESGQPIEIDGRSKVLGTWQLLSLALGGSDHRALRCNIDFFLGLRHRIEHRYIPALDPMVASEAQAMLLNFETIITTEFGEESTLGTQLVVPLQLSALRNDAQLKSLKQLESQIPIDVMEFLARHREEVPVEVLRSHEYALPIFFVPVTANRERSAEAVVNFLRPGDVPDEVEKALKKITVIQKPKPVPVVSADLLLPKEVVNSVSARLPFRFTMATHTRCWQYYRVRPAWYAAEPAATDPEFCIWDKLMRAYGYTPQWVEMLVSELSDPEKYKEVVGVDPTPV